MTLVTRKKIDELAAAVGEPLVSLYLPTHRTTPDNRQDPIRLKNLIARVEDQLVARGMRETTARDFLGPARQLLQDTHFWSHQADGLALFLSADDLKLHRVPIEVPELAVVSERFHLKPLLQLLSGDGRIFVLALSLRRIRLFEASRDSVRELDLHDIPTSLLDVVGYDFEQRSLQFHTGSGRRAGVGRGAVFHGHGEGRDDQETEVTRFLQVVAHGVESMLRNEHSPLVLAGVEYLTALFRQATSYPHLLERAIRGSPDHMTPLEIHAMAWPAARREIARAEAEAARRCQEAAPGTSRDLPKVVQAAFEGRVDTVFVPVGVQHWGRFDEASHAAELHAEWQPGDRDLLDVVALQSLATGGEVYAVAPEEIPGGGEVAATLRY